MHVHSDSAVQILRRLQIQPCRRLERYSKIQMGLFLDEFVVLSIMFPRTISTILGFTREFQLQWYIW